jgi:hypothetical protein
LMDDPGWKKAQDSVNNMWGVKVSKELAKKIDADAEMLGGHVSAMLMNLSEIAAQTDPMTGGNVGKWATRLSDTFSVFARGEMDAAQAAKTLDTNFGALLESGTAVSGMVAPQIARLVALERQYKTGSKAIKEFSDAQLSLVSGGFNKVVGGAFGALMANWDDDTATNKLEELIGKAQKLQAIIDDFKEKPPSNEKQRIQLLQAERDLLTTNHQIERERARDAARSANLEAMMGEAGQQRFDRLGRLAGVTFDAMIASGKGIFEAIDAIGPGLDTLILAQERLGLQSSDTLTRLLKFREFATVHPELVDAIDGLNQMFIGLHNTGFMTADAFRDLGAEVTATFNDVVAGGLTGTEAMQAMHNPLQRLWEMQRMFGYAVDEATQALIDEAVAAGTVGTQYMSANDRMVLGIEKLITRFESFLRHLGIHIPTAAEEAADAVERSFNGIVINPIDLHYQYVQDGDAPTGPGEPVLLAKGGVLNKPTFVAGEAGAEVVMPLDRLFAEIRAWGIVDDAGTRPIIVKSYLDGRLVSQTTVRHQQSELRRLGLIE